MRWELDWLENRARLTPNAEAIVDAEEKVSWTYADLNQRGHATACWLLQKGVNKGDRIAILSPNHIVYFDLLFACMKIGAIFVPINWRLSTEEIKFILKDCSPKIVCYHSKFMDSLEQIKSSSNFYRLDEIDFKTNETLQESNLSENDSLAIIYTGGTTGKPKGVVLTHQSILWNGINTIISWNITNEDTTLTYLPLFHTGGLNALSIPLLMAGGKVVLPNDFSPVKAIHFLNEYKCTIALFVPTMYHMMVETEEFKNSTFSSMKIFLSGGAPCPLEIYEAFRKKGLLFKEGYGLTEAGPNNFFLDPKDANRKLGSVGKPMMFNRIKLIKENGHEASTDEVGEILIKGKHSFYHYWKNEESTADAIKDGWLHTGDLAKHDDEGFYYIVGRKKDMIITGGENVYPLEIEHWISSHTAVDEVAVVGLPDRKWGEVVTAFVVVKKENQLTVDEIQAHCSYKLGKYKIPKIVTFLEELPKTHVGKIDKKKLKEKGIEAWNYKFN